MSDEQETFLVFSINHESAPLEERERYSVDDARVQELYSLLGESKAASEAVVLNTCNRFELYARKSDGATHRQIISALSRFYGYEESDLSRHLKTRTGKEAIQHLIEVSAGLRSQITGEAEIFGQVKAAYAMSHKNGYAGKVINRAFQKGFQAAKFIRNATAVGQGQINIANVAVELSSKIFGSLKRSSALAIGTGEIGEKTVKALVSRGIPNVGVASRSLERAQEAAAMWSAKPHAIDQLEAHLPDYDIVIASTETDDPVITSELVKRSGALKRDMPLFLIDLGMPRNIEQSCETLDNVYLYNLDDLASIAEENLADRRRAVEECQEIAAQKASAIWETLQRRGDV